MSIHAPVVPGFTTAPPGSEAARLSAHGFPRQPVLHWRGSQGYRHLGLHRSKVLDVDPLEAGPRIDLVRAWRWTGPTGLGAVGSGMHPTGAFSIPACWWGGLTAGRRA